MKKTVFISYRHDDAAANAGRLSDHLQLDGRTRVFFDTEEIRSGDDFTRILEEQLAKTDVLLAVIGPKWLTIADEHGRRIDQPDDFVRREVASALTRGTCVIPVLVGGARRPHADELPEPLKDLVRRTAATIHDATFKRDFQELLEAILGIQPPPPDLLKRLKYVGKSLIVVAPLLAIINALAVWSHVFDYLTLDSRVARSLMWAADAVSPPPRAEREVLIAAIDEKTENKLKRKFAQGPSAEWRRDHARLIDRAAAAGAAAVAFDFAFESESTADEKLAEATRLARDDPHSTRVVFGVKKIDNGQPALAAGLRDAGAWGSLCMSKRLGFFDVPLAVIRGRASDVTVLAKTPALALAAAYPEQLEEIDLERRRIGFVGASWQRYSAIERIRSVGGDCQMYERADEGAMLYVRPSPPDFWRDPARRVSYADLLEREALPDERLKGRIVLVGVMKPGLDEHGMQRGCDSKVVWGVELQADAIANLASVRAVKTPTVGWQLLITAAMVLFGAAASVPLSRAARRSILWPVVGVYVFGAIGITIAGTLLNVVYDLVAALFAAYALLRWLQARRLRAARERTSR